MSDPNALRTVDQILMIPGGGDFLSEFLEKHRELQLNMVNHQIEHGGSASGGFTIDVKYSLGKHGNIVMKANSKFTNPKKPSTDGVVWMTNDGFLTPENPKQMKMQIRDVDGHREFRTPESEVVND